MENSFHLLDMLRYRVGEDYNVVYIVSRKVYIYMDVVICPCTSGHAVPIGEPISTTFDRSGPRWLVNI